MPYPFPGRYSTSIDGPFVVFLIGVRINRLLAIGKWLPVTKAMGPMRKELYANPSPGLLAAYSSMYWRGIMVTQYWAASTISSSRPNHAMPCTSRHGRPSTRPSAQTVESASGTKPTRSPKGQYECVYANMPRCCRHA
jgi:hypothetical protein